MHFYDVWHIAKGLKKTLGKFSQSRGNELVQKWQQSILNHLYLCARSSDGNGDMAEERWVSLLNHLIDKHDHDNQLFSSCEHTTGLTRAWFQPGTEVYESLTDILTKRCLIQSIRKMSSDGQTSSLDGYHPTLTHFAPKMYHFGYTAMKSRLQLAALHFNENAGRAQAVNKKDYVIDLQMELQYMVSNRIETVMVEQIPRPLAYMYSAARPNKDDAYLLDCHLAEVWSRFLSDLFSSPYLPPNPYSRLCTHLREAALMMDVWHESSVRVSKRLTRNSTVLHDPHTFVHGLTGIDAYGVSSAVSYLDVSAYLTVKPVIEPFMPAAHLMKRGHFRIAVCTCLSCPISLYGRILPYLTHYEIHSHIYIKGPAGCSDEAVQICAGLVYDELMEYSHQQQYVMTGFYMGTPEERYCLNNIRMKRHSFVAEFERVCLQKQPLQLRLYIVDNWRYVAVIKKYLLHYVSDSASNEIFFPPEPWNSYHDVFLNKQQAIFHYQNNDVLMKTDPLGPVSLSHLSQCLALQIKQAMDRCDYIQVYSLVTTWAMAKQDNALLVDMWRFHHSNAIQVNYVMSLIDALQDLMIYAKEHSLVKNEAIHVAEDAKKPELKYTWGQENKMELEALPAVVDKSESNKKATGRANKSKGAKVIAVVEEATVNILSSLRLSELNLDLRLLIHSDDNEVTRSDIKEHLNMDILSNMVTAFREKLLELYQDGTAMAPKHLVTMVMQCIDKVIKQDLYTGRYNILLDDSVFPVLTELWSLLKHQQAISANDLYSVSFATKTAVNNLIRK